MYEDFGFANSRGKHGGFALFIPDAAVDPTQYGRGGPNNIVDLRVVGDFQPALPAGGAAWDPAAGLPMRRGAHPNGHLYVAELPVRLPAGVHQYKYVVRFADGTRRWVSDPCAKLGGSADGNSAFVVGDPPLPRPRAVPRPRAAADLVIYELMIADFTAGYRGTRAPVDAITERLPYLKALGVNAIEFMPWIAWPDDPAEPFSWGYDPAHFFAVEHQYVDDGSGSPSRARRLLELVRACHDAGLEVIMDVVLQHAKCMPLDRGFGYLGLWQDPDDCPFIGDFTGAPTYGSQPLDYDNRCAAEFATDVCWYWLQRFGIDGLRVDQSSGFFKTGDADEGVPAVIAGVRQRALAAGRVQPRWFLEDTWDYQAIARTGFAQASGCWLDPYRAAFWYGLAAPGGVGTGVMRALDAQRDFAPGTLPVIYLENHDHSGIACQAGGRARWFRTQPAAIALFTSPGALLLRNGQEFGWDVQMLEDDGGAPADQRRVQPLPLPWPLAEDDIGRALRALYTRLAALRAAHPALRGGNVYPTVYDQGWTRFDSQGYGIDTARQLAIYHRWGEDQQGALRRYIIALNFSATDQAVDLPFPTNGGWTDLLAGNAITVAGWRFPAYVLHSNWGCVFCQ